MFASIYSALGSPLPSPKPPEAYGGEWIVGEIAGISIIGLGMTSSLIMGSIAALMFVLSTWKFVSIVMARPIVQTPLAHMDCEEQAEDNDETLEELEKKLLFAGVRLPISIVLFIIAVQVYVYSLNPDFYFLLFYSFVLLSPKITPLFMTALGIYPEKPQSDRPNFSQEMLHEGPNSRVSSIKMLNIEKYPWKVNNLIMVFILLSFGLSSLWSLVVT